MIFRVPEPTRERRGPGRPTEPGRRRRLLEIARDAFAEHGYVGASLSEIGRRAGLSKPALLHHFGDKQGLYEAVMRGIVEDLTRLVIDARVDEGSFVERLDRLGALVVEYFGDEPSAARLLLTELVGRGPVGRGEGAQQVQTSLRIIEAFLSAGMGAGVFRRQDPKQLTMSLVGLHMVYFAASDVASRFVEDDVFAPTMILERKRAVLESVRALCLA